VWWVVGSPSLYGGGGGGVKVEGVVFALVFCSVGVPEVGDLEGQFAGLDEQDRLSALMSISDCRDSIAIFSGDSDGDVTHFGGGKVVQSL